MHVTFQNLSKITYKQIYSTYQSVNLVFFQDLFSIKEKTWCFMSWLKWLSVSVNNKSRGVKQMWSGRNQMVSAMALPINHFNKLDTNSWIDVKIDKNLPKDQNSHLQSQRPDWFNLDTGRNVPWNSIIGINQLYCSIHCVASI